MYFKNIHINIVSAERNNKKVNERKQDTEKKVKENEQ